MPLRQSHTAIEWSRSSPTVATFVPSLLNPTDATPRSWNPRSVDSVAIVSALHRFTIGTFPTCPVAMITLSGCSASDTMSSVCAE